MMRKPDISNTYNRRIRLSSREILLALVVTFAAIAFAVAARHVKTTGQVAGPIGVHGAGHGDVVDRNR